jgi:hypothetical protein
MPKRSTFVAPFFVPEIQQSLIVNGFMCLVKLNIAKKSFHISD